MSDVDFKVCPRCNCFVARPLEWEPVQLRVEIERLRAENAKLIERVRRLTETRMELSKSQDKLRTALERLDRQRQIAEWDNKIFVPHWAIVEACAALEKTK